MGLSSTKMTNDEWSGSHYHSSFVIYRAKAEILYKFSAPGVYGLKT